MKIVTTIITCAQRHKELAQTLKGLNDIVWPNQSEVIVCMDPREKTESRPQERQLFNALDALTEALKRDPDYILFLEDDLEFNKHLWHNITRWPVLGDVGLASLYNPTIQELSRNDKQNWFIADPNCVYGSQAYLVSREAAKFMVANWHSVIGMQDIKMSRLAAKMNDRPIYYHSPSLVQHVGQNSTFGGGFHYAPEYDADFKAEVPKLTAWNGDTFIDCEMNRLIQKYRIQTVIETGCWSAHSTRRFRELLPLGRGVYTIESTDEHLVAEFGPKAVSDLWDSEINFIKGDSSVELARLLPKIKYLALIYLDAHGGGANGSNVNPLLPELEAMANHQPAQDNCVIAVHDCYVPGKPWGYNSGDWGRGVEPISYDLMKPYFRGIYPKGYRYHHNDEAEGATRGILYLYPS